MQWGTEKCDDTSSKATQPPGSLNDDDDETVKQTVSLKMFLKLFTGWNMIFIATSGFSKCSNMASFQTLLPRGHNKKLILIRNFWVVRCR